MDDGFHWVIGPSFFFESLVELDRGGSRYCEYFFLAGRAPLGLAGALRGVFRTHSTLRHVQELVVNAPLFCV